MKRGAIALAAIVSCQGIGCAAVINGLTSKVEVKSSTPGAKVYIDGFDTGNAPVQVPNYQNHVVLVRAPGYADHFELLHPHVAAAPVVLDIVLAGPSFLIAPLVDLLLGPWYTVSSIEQPIVLNKTVKTPRPRPVYQVGALTIASRVGGTADAPLPLPSSAPAKVDMGLRINKSIETSPRPK